MSPTQCSIRASPASHLEISKLSFSKKNTLPLGRGAAAGRDTCARAPPFREGMNFCSKKYNALYRVAMRRSYTWGNFVALLTYKAESAGRILIKVNPKNTSSTCSCCGNINKLLTLRNRVYDCDACGIAIDRDINAAINVRRLGTSLAISGEINSPDSFRSLAL